MSDDKNTRIPKLAREEWTEEAKDAFSFWEGEAARETGSKTNVMMVFAQHPALLNAYNIWGKHLLIDNTVPNREREIIILRVAWLVKSEYEWHYHVGYGLNFGMTLEEVAAVRDGPGHAIWNEKDAATMRAVDELMDGGDVSDATWATLSKYYDRRQLMDLVMMTGHYVMTSWALTAFRVPLEDGVDKIDFDLKTQSGQSPQASVRPRDN